MQYFPALHYSHTPLLQEIRQEIERLVANSNSCTEVDCKFRTIEGRTVLMSDVPGYITSAQVLTGAPLGAEPVYIAAPILTLAHIRVEPRWVRARARTFGMLTTFFHNKVRCTIILQSSTPFQYLQEMDFEDIHFG